MRLFAVFVAGFLSTAAFSQSVVVLAGAEVVGRGGKLVEDIGIETLGGTFTPLLNRGCAIPCSLSETFSTGEDNQSEIKLSVFRGNARLTKDAKRMGVIAIQGVPPGPRGIPVIQVTFVASQDGIRIAAIDRNTKRSLNVVRRES